MTHASGEVNSSPRAPLEPRTAGLAFAGAALVAGAAPYTGEALGFFVKVDPKVEVVDHVVPAAVIVIVCGFVLVSGRFPFAVMLVIALAGLWITATHVPLLARAGGASVEWTAALWHSLPGMIILAAAVAGSTILWRDPQPPRPR